MPIATTEAARATAAARWTPEARLESAVSALEKYGHLLTEAQIIRIRRVVTVPR